MSGAGVTTSSCDAGSRLSVWPLLPLVLTLVLFSLLFAMSSGVILGIF